MSWKRKPITSGHKECTKSCQPLASFAKSHRLRRCRREENTITKFNFKSFALPEEKTRSSFFAIFTSCKKMQANKISNKLAKKKRNPVKKLKASVKKTENRKLQQKKLQLCAANGQNVPHSFVQSVKICFGEKVSFFCVDSNQCNSRCWCFFRNRHR